MPVMPKTFKVKSITSRTHLSEKDNWGRGRGGRPWRRLREEILRRDNYLCQCDECIGMGIYRRANEVDHIIPRYRGGTDDMSNLRAINDKCHKKKTQSESKSSKNSMHN